MFQLPLSPLPLYLKTNKQKTNKKLSTLIYMLNLLTSARGKMAKMSLSAYNTNRLRMYNTISLKLWYSILSPFAGKKEEIILRLIKFLTTQVIFKMITFAYISIEAIN